MCLACPRFSNEYAPDGCCDTLSLLLRETHCLAGKIWQSTDWGPDWSGEPTASVSQLKWLHREWLLECRPYCCSAKFAAPWPAFLEVSTPGPSPNPSLNPSLNLSLSLSLIQFILFNFVNPDLNLNFLNLDLNLNLYGGGFAYAYVMLCAWSNTDSATAHGEAWNSVGLLFGSILGWCIPGFVCVGPKSAPTDRPCARHVQLGAGVLKSLLWPKTKWNHCWYGILPRWWNSGHGFAHKKKIKKIKKNKKK